MTLRKSSWLRASLQGTTLLGAVMVALIWAGLLFHLQTNYQNVLKEAFNDTANLSRSIEEHISRTIRGEDGTLIVLRAMHERDPSSFNFVDWSKNAGLVSNVTLQYSIIDSKGVLVASSLGPVKPIDLSDRQHFKAHVDATKDELFIGRPLTGRFSGKTSIHVSRKLTNSDGSFGGAIVASLDPEQLIKFYKTINLGNDGTVSVSDLEGYILASRGFKNPNLTRFGEKGVVHKLAATNPSGSVVTPGGIDGISRVVSYRTVEGLPLIVTVGLAQPEVFAQYRRDQAAYFVGAALITGLTLIVMVLSIIHRRKLDRAHDWLRKSETFLRASRQELKTTLDNIDQGILTVDANGRVRVINQRVIDILDLPREWLTNKPSLTTILNLLRDRGEFGDNGECVQEDVWEMIKAGGLSPAVNYERTQPNGNVLEVRTRPLSDGGIVRTFTDITESKRAEAKIAELATHDDLTGLANRKLFRDHIQQALGRSHRYGESFSVLLFDLDRFKEINDSYGHPAGDAVLKEAAYRLSNCVREHDTVARLGGDEFAILQAKTRTDEEAAQLAERIVQAIRVPFHLDGEEITLATSIGIALAPRDGADYDQLVKKADEALYRAKGAGGNLFCFHRSGFMSRSRQGQVVDFTRAVS